MSKKFLYRASASFSLLVNQEVQSTLIVMKLNTVAVSTKYVPNITQLLQFICPSVLKTQCFNDQNLPFRQEVRETEIGHLFEHILLEELCLHKLDYGCTSVVFNGRTSWNWIKEPRGLFHITVDADFSDQLIFQSALARSIEITEKLLSYLPTSQKYHRALVYKADELESYLSK